MFDPHSRHTHRISVIAMLFLLTTPTINEIKPQAAQTLDPTHACIASAFYFLSISTVKTDRSSL